MPVSPVASAPLSVLLKISPSDLCWAEFGVVVQTTQSRERFEEVLDALEGLPS